MAERLGAALAGGAIIMGTIAGCSGGGEHRASQTPEKSASPHAHSSRKAEGSAPDKPACEFFEGRTIRKQEAAEALRGVARLASGTVIRRPALVFSAAGKVERVGYAANAKDIQLETTDLKLVGAKGVEFFVAPQVLQDTTARSLDGCNDRTPQNNLQMIQAITAESAIVVDGKYVPNFRPDLAGQSVSKKVADEGMFATVIAHVPKGYQEVSLPTED